MSWILFIDESGHDLREAHYEVLAGIAVQDRELWKLIQKLIQCQKNFFGDLLYRSFGKEIKARELLKSKTFRLARQAGEIPADERLELIAEHFRNPSAPKGHQLTALAQAKIRFIEECLRQCRISKCQAFASIIPRDVERPEGTYLRKDYAFLFERYFHLLNKCEPDEIGLVVFDQIEKAHSQRLVDRMEAYFTRSQNGRERSRLIVPEPMFVESDLSTMVQMADVIAYVISWGLRLHGMSENARPELQYSQIATEIWRMQYTFTPMTAHPVRGFKLIRNLA